MIDFFELFALSFKRPIENPVLIFSLMLFIILLSPIILRKFKIPGIIGLIISGVLIGPHGFGLLENDSSIKLFSTIGLLYIMFLAGLDLDMNRFKSTGNKSLLFGFFTFTIPLALGFPVCKYFLHFDYEASLLTSSMFATHTLVAYPIVSKFGIAKNSAVAVTVGGTILTDTLVLIILAVIINSSDSGSINNEFFIRLGISLVIFITILFFIIPRIARWFFQKLESEKHSHYIFVLAVMFFAAFLAEIAGLEPIIGAFAAGLALNRLIPNSSFLMNRIEFIGNSLFIPFFLISVGMLVDISVLVNGYMAIIIAFTLTIVALVGKWIAALFTQWSFRFSKHQRRLIFGLSSSHAAATLAIILAGYNAKILDENVLNGTIILILITCLIASFVTEVAAKDIVVSDNIVNQVYEKQKNIEERILLPISKFTNTPDLLNFAILIKDHKLDNPLSILTVIPNNAEAELNIEKAKIELQHYVIQASSAETKVEIITTIDHNIAGGIVRSSREIGANLIILGWPQKVTGVIDKILESNMTRIVRHIEKNIFICQFVRPFTDTRNIFLMTPPLTEMESGFERWFLKVLKLANELSVSIEFYGGEVTYKKMQGLVKKHRTNNTFRFQFFEVWEDFLILSKKINNDDLIVQVSSRQGFLSYQNSFDQITEKMSKYFPENNKIVIYPEQKHTYGVDFYEDISSETITKSIKTIEKIRKIIGKIIKK